MGGQGFYSSGDEIFSLVIADANSARLVDLLIGICVVKSGCLKKGPAFFLFSAFLRKG